MAKLIFTGPKLAGQVYELTLEKTAVGRADKNTLVIHDSSVSSQHCEILVNGYEVIVRDLNSHNGTFVDGVRLKHQSQAKSGQTVRFGSVEARLELDAVSQDSDASTMSAIYTHGKVMREQRRAQQSPPKNPSMHLDAGAHTGSDEPTVMLRQSELPKGAPTPPAREATEPHFGKHKTPKYLAIAVVVVIGLVVFLWLVWGRK